MAKTLVLLATAGLAIDAQTPQNTTWYLSGRVALDDGSVPAGRVDIQCICNGSLQVATHSDSRGEFSFRVGGGPASRVMQDASVGSVDGSFGRPRVTFGPPPQASQTDGAGGNPPPPPQTQTAPASTRAGPNEQLLRNCDLHAVLPGYRSDPISLAGRRPSDPPGLGTIILSRLSASEDPSVSITWLAAPKDARKAFDKGREALRKNHVDQAGKHFQRAVGIYPRYAAAWCELGGVQILERRFDEARLSFRTAMEADPKYVEPYLRLSALAAEEKQWRQLLEVSVQALVLEPLHHPQEYFLNALAHLNLGNLEAAEKSAREAERLDPQRRHPRTWHLLAIILTNRGAYAEAAVQLREYLAMAPQAPDGDTARVELARVEKLTPH